MNFMDSFLKRLNPNSLTKIFIPIVFGLVIVGFMFTLFSPVMNEKTQVCTVTDKDRTVSDGGSDMRVYTEECGVLSVKDVPVTFTFNSADTYNQIQVGDTYRLTTGGYRIPLWSVFPVITKVEPVE